MNKIIKIYLPILVALILCGTFVEQVDAQKWAKDLFSEFSHDFGDVTKGETPEYRFKLKNIYNEDINIIQVFSSCGCTQASITKNKIKTWEESEIVCRFNSKPFNGSKQATVTVKLGPPLVGEVQLSVKGNIVSAIRMNPSELQFGQVSRGRDKTLGTTITGAANVPFRIVDIKSTFPHVGVSLSRATRVGNTIQYQMQTKLKESAPEGFSQGELYVVVEESGKRRQIPLKFSAEMTAPIKISPAVLTLNDLKPGEQVTKTVVVRAGQPFQITDVKCRTKAFRVTAKKGGSAKTHILKVTYTAPENPKSSECDLTFFTNLTNAPSGKVKAIIDFDDAPVEVDDAPVEADDAPVEVDDALELDDALEIGDAN